METLVIESISLVAKMNVTLTLRKARDTIGIYKGDKENFEDWMHALEVQSRINSFGDEHIIRLTLMTTTGSICHFIMAFVNEKPSIKWSDLKAHLMTRYLDATVQQNDTNKEKL